MKVSTMMRETKSSLKSFGGRLSLLPMFVLAMVLLLLLHLRSSSNNIVVGIDAHAADVSDMLQSKDTAAATTSIVTTDGSSGGGTRNMPPPVMTTLKDEVLRTATTSSTTTSASTSRSTACGDFQYYHEALDSNNLPSTISAAFDLVDKKLEILSKKLNVPSLSFGIVYDQQLVHYKSIGSTDLKQKDSKPNVDSIYRIGSISKVFTTLLAYILRDRNCKCQDCGCVDGDNGVNSVVQSMDDSIHYQFNTNFTIFNPWGITKEEQLGKTLTLKQLVSQISGLPREVPCYEDIDCVNTTTNVIFERLSKQSLIHPTDVQGSYSNLAYAIVGNVLSGKYCSVMGYTTTDNDDDDDTSSIGFHPDDYKSLFNQTLNDLIVQPLNLNNTGIYVSTEEQTKHASTGYIPDPDNYNNFFEVEYTDIGWIGPAGQVFSSVKDLSILMKQYFKSYPSLYQRHIDCDKDDADDETKFLTSPQTLREMLRPVYLNPDQVSGFGSPWELEIYDGGSPNRKKKVGRKHLLHQKGGNIDGFSSHISMIPEMKLGVISLINTETSEFAFSHTAWEILLPAFETWMEEMKNAPQNQPAVPSDIDEYVGHYGIYDDDGNYVDIFEITYDDKSNTVSIQAHGAYGQVVVEGLLSWNGGNRRIDDDDVVDETSFTFHDTGSRETCMAVTLSAYDGDTLHFVKDPETGRIVSFHVDGTMYGVEFPKKTDNETRDGDSIKANRGSNMKQKNLIFKNLRFLRTAPYTNMGIEDSFTSLHYDETSHLLRFAKMD